MSLFSKLKSTGLEESQDRLGGYSPLETDIYTGVIKAFYLGQSSQGATSITVVFDTQGKEYRETLYVTNKNGENYFMNKDDKTKKVPLPGFTVADDICLMSTGLPLADLEDTVEEKIVKIYDYEAKKEVNTAVQMIMGVVGQTVSLGIVKQTVNKKEKDANGEYQPLAESRDENVIDKAYHTETKLTASEYRAEKTAGEFWDAWLERNKGETRDRRTIKDGAGGQTRGAAPKAKGAGEGDAPPARKALFGKK